MKDASAHEAAGTDLGASRAIVVMGVSGCGKTTVGRLLAATLGWAFVEGDDLHPQSNVAKMASGQPLEDVDRWPWLDAVGGAMRAELETGAGVVSGCSALRRSYRERLRDAAQVPLVFAFLDGSESLIAARLSARADHFMPQALLRSQFETLERPGADECAIHVCIDQNAHAIVDVVLTHLEVAR